MTGKSLFRSCLAQNQWPLRFDRHSYGAQSCNTPASCIGYDRHQFGQAERGYDGTVYNKPAPSPHAPNWKDTWSAGYTPGKIFPSPVDIQWTSLDGREHEASIDLDAIFKDRLVLHRVAKEDIPESWAADPLSVDVLVELNDRVISVYMATRVATKQEQTPGNRHSRGRRDVILAWSHTY
jgi:hypothetical protein